MVSLALRNRIYYFAYERDIVKVVFCFPAEVVSDLPLSSASIARASCRRGVPGSGHKQLVRWKYQRREP